jgi:hypothetical protein
VIDLNSSECIVRAAQRCRAVMLERIAADPEHPTVYDLQLVADHAQQIITDNERRTA